MNFTNIHKRALLVMIDYKLKSIKDRYIYSQDVLYNAIMLMI